MSGTVRWLQATLTAILIGALIIEIAVYSPPVARLERTLGVSIQEIRNQSNSADVVVSIAHRTADSALELAALPLERPAAVRRNIFVFNDSSYPTANALATVSEGVFDHLSAGLRTRGYPSSITSVAEDQLAGVLADTATAHDRAIVLMTGELPSSIFSKTLNAITPWVRAGGLCVWGGAAIGYWSGRRGRPLAQIDVVGQAGTERLLGSGILHYPPPSGTRGDTASEVAAALDLGYNISSQGILRDKVIAAGGIPLGWFAGKYSSISYIPRGKGGFLIFGGEAFDAEMISHDLTQILLSDAISGNGVAAKLSIDLTRMPSLITRTWTLPFPIPKAGVRLVAFDPHPDAIFFYTEVISASAST